MNGEPQPAGDNLDRALFALKAVWFGFLSGSIVIAVTAVAVATSNEVPISDLGDLAYLFLLPVPMGLAGAFVLAPLLGHRDPAAVVRSQRSANPMYDGWDAAKPDDPYYWYPAYVPGFFLGAGILEGTAIVCAIGFLLTSNWVVLGGALLLIAALATQIPTRSAVEAFAEDARRRQQNSS